MKPGFIYTPLCTALLLWLVTAPVQAQRKRNQKTVDTFSTVGISRGELVPAYNLNPVDIHKRALSAEEKQQYYRLVYNIRRTYPYAVMAKERMDELNAARAAMSKKKETRKYMKEQEKQIKDDFLEDLKNMTKSQGAILIKLLARQTDTTAYFLLKDFMGTTKAGSYQAVARLWGYNLKKGYDPWGEDMDIEIIVSMIESGRLSVIPPKKSALEKNSKKKKKKKQE